MKSMITDTNGFEPISALRKIAAHPAVYEIEGGGCDPGRVFVHLKDGWTVKGYDTRSFGVGVALDSEGASMKPVEISRKNRNELANKMSFVTQRT